MNAKTERSNVRRVSFLLLILLLLVVGGGLVFWKIYFGCHKGGPLPKGQIAYEHDAVAWVYRTGEQTGRFWGVLPVSVRNELLDLQPGDGCVHVTEGHTGGQCSAAPQADLQLSHALDLKTGRSISARGSAKRIDHPKPICRTDGGYWETPIEGSLSAYSAGETGRLYLRLPSEVLILHVKYPDPEVTYEPWLGVPIAAFRMPEDLLILGLSQGYVVCIDLKKLQTDTSMQTRLSDSMPSK